MRSSNRQTLSVLRDELVDAIESSGTDDALFVTLASRPMLELIELVFSLKSRVRRLEEQTFGEGYTP